MQPSLLEAVEERAAHVVACLGLPQLDGLRGQRLDVARLVNNASTGRAGTNVNADEVVVGVVAGLRAWTLPVRATGLEGRARGAVSC